MPIISASVKLPELSSELNLTGPHILEDIFTGEIFDDIESPIPFGQYFLKPVRSHHCLP